MKKLLIIAMAFGLFLVPFTINAQADQQATDAPPVAPTLVREGDFAMKLVSAFNIGTAKDEAEAETMLASSGIAPKNGWIADYPMTPDIVGELQNAVDVAVDSQTLPMGKDEALKILRTAAVELGLPIIVEIPSGYEESSPPTSPQYTEPSVVNNYYYNEGPPVVTYYPPPWDYDYLYAWVPTPFWCSGFFFPGFFILHDFHRAFIGRHHNMIVVSNHVVNPVTKGVFVIDPRTRSSGRVAGATASISPKGGFDTTAARSGASSIFNRTLQREADTGGNNRNSVSSMSSGKFERQQVIPGRVGSATTLNGNTSVVISPSTTNHSTGVNHTQTGHIPNEVTGRSFNAPSRSPSIPSISSRSFNRPSDSSGRSFSAPSRSFSAPSTVNRGPSGGFQAGGGNHGGFSGGFSHGGGCRGRC